MVIKFEKETEGVLLICSKKGLKKYFADKEFDYNFPEGILPLINNGSVIALTTESSDEIKGEFIDIAMNEYKGYQLAGEQNLYIDEEDEIYVLSHAEFTQICDNHKGDIDAFDFWNEKIVFKNLRPGWAIVFTHYKMRKNSIYLKTITQLVYTNNRFPYGEISFIPAV
jgi:hypothetical protein